MEKAVTRKVGNLSNSCVLYKNMLYKCFNYQIIT